MAGDDVTDAVVISELLGRTYSSSEYSSESSSDFGSDSSSASDGDDDGIYPELIELLSARNETLRSIINLLENNFREGDFCADEGVYPQLASLFNARNQTLWSIIEIYRKRLRTGCHFDDGIFPRLISLLSERNQKIQSVIEILWKKCVAEDRQVQLPRVITDFQPEDFLSPSCTGMTTRKPFKLVGSDGEKKGVVVGSVEELVEKGRRLFQITCLDVKAAIYEDDTEIVEDEFLLSLPDYTSVVVTARTEQMEIAPVAVPATVPRIKTSDSPVAVVPPSTTGSLTTPRIIMLRNPQGIPQLTLMQSVPSVKLINNMSQL